MLPKDVPNCRILTFSYFMPHDSDPAIKLTEELAADRGGRAKERPIVFLCNSSGGALVRDALAYSESYDDGEKEEAHTPSIHVSTFGLLVFDNGGLLYTGSKFLQIVPSSFQRFCD
ncbi:hypothetical protein SI65_05954 [Aspergillus cristatus]|uniref:Uncharacterized protein n=1 Tax=Aspergillus cristatus TaxID=573508 RepID=A0A1E3BG08_ASPCR|nr:hypothetical protein SI65_05954 [Aspergillus cristatus]